MPLTTTSGYTFPVAGVPTTQTPSQYGSSPTNEARVNESSERTLRPYSDFNGDWKAYLEYLADNGDPASLDKLLNYLMSEQSANIAREWTAKREDTAWQRLVADMRAAGINPYAFATFGANPIASGSSGHNYSGSYASNQFYRESLLAQNETKIKQNWLKIALSAFLPIIGAVIAGML